MTLSSYLHTRVRRRESPGPGRQRHAGDRVPLHFGYAQCKSSGDGARVAQVTPDGVTTLYVGELYEVRRGSPDAVTRYYYLGGQRVAMRQPDDTVVWLHGDHLGSTSLTTGGSGNVGARQAYYPFGATRWVTGTLPTDFGFTGQRNQSTIKLYDYHARFYDPYVGRFISADTIVPEPGNPQALNRYSYVNNRPLVYVDPSGHTVKGALDLVREYREDIKAIAAKHDIDPLLLAGVVFSENRNDHNWIRGQDWTSVFTLDNFGGPELKNLFAPLLKDNPSLGITEVSVAVAAMMDQLEVLPDEYREKYGELSWKERGELHERIVKNLAPSERQDIIDSLSDPTTSLEYTAKYLAFLASYRDYGDNYALWLSDYNRGLSDWDTTTEYGQRIDVYRENIEHVLYWQESAMPICIGRLGCATFYENLLYGSLP